VESFVWQAYFQQIEVVNWGHNGPDGMVNRPASGGPIVFPPNVLHAVNPGGPNWPGVGAANPTLIERAGGPVTWTQLLDVINQGMGASPGLVGREIVGNNKVQYVNGDPTILQVKDVHTRNVVVAALMAAMGPGFEMRDICTSGTYNAWKAR
jgi:hypothetical protein